MNFYSLSLISIVKLSDKPKLLNPRDCQEESILCQVKQLFFTHCSTYRICSNISCLCHYFTLINWYLLKLKWAWIMVIYWLIVDYGSILKNSSLIILAKLAKIHPINESCFGCLFLSPYQSGNYRPCSAVPFIDFLFPKKPDNLMLFGIIVDSIRCARSYEQSYFSRIRIRIIVMFNAPS